MNLLTPSGDFVYGNTRLRARKAELLGSEGYDALLGRDVAATLEALAQTAYRPDVEAALARSHGEPALAAALRLHAGRTFGELRSFYQGRARELVDVLLARVDLHNLLALLRAHVRAQPAERALRAVLPVGGLGGAAAEEVARQPEPAAAVALLVAWRLPDAESAAALGRAWPEYERTQERAALEHAVAAAHALRIDRLLAGASEEAAPLRELVARERDAVNALAALRLRAALEQGELGETPPPRDWSLAGGRISEQALETALRTPGRAEAAAALAAAVRRDDWRAPLERHGNGGDLPLLERELEAARVRWALGLFLRGDPLGVGVAIAYTVAKENELRNLRLVAEAAADGAPADAVRARLLLPDPRERWAG